MLRAESLRVGFGQTAVLRDISFTVEAGSFVVLLGRNGAGKTTMLRSIMGLLPPIGGEIYFEETNLIRQPPCLRADLGIGYMPEDRRLVPHWTVKDNLLLAVWASRKTLTETSIDRALEYIPELRDMLNRRAGKLSGGQQKLVALARALMLGKRLLLLDEPFEGVAPALASRLLEILQTAVKAEKQTVMLTESDRSLSESLRTHVFALERGHLSCR